MEGSRENNTNKRRSSNQKPISSKKKAKYDVDQNQDLIPPDLTIDVLKRLPPKTLMKFRCVSKLWSSIISSREFVNLYLARSSTRPRLLAAYPNNHGPRLRLYSSPHHQNPTKISSFLAERDFTIDGLNYLFVSKPVNGLVCTETCSGLKICNPATKQFINLPTPMMKTHVPPAHPLVVKIFFAYDPIDDQYKVLYRMRDVKMMIMEHQIFVLGENAWRRIQNPPVYSYSVATNDLSINGVMYYVASTKMHNLYNEFKTVAFNVKHENFKLINMPDGHKRFFHYKAELINFEGKLAVVGYRDLVQTNTINVWVLEDESKGEWSEKSYVLPSCWRDFINGTNSGDQHVEDFVRGFVLTGTMYASEIMIAPRGLWEPFFVVYYNLKTNSFRRVKTEGLPNHEFIPGMGHSSPYLIVTEYAESIKLLDGFKLPVSNLGS